MIGLPLHGKKIERVLTELVTCIGVEFVGASSPSITECDDMIDLNLC